MKYEQLKNFILNVMDMRNGKNYQPVMIRYLNQNRGKATKKQIQEALHNANPTKSTKDFSDSPVFDVLTDSRNVARRNTEKTEYELLDYETFTPAQKAHITMYCDQKINDSSNPVNPRIVLFSAAGKKSFEHFNETITKNVISNTLPGDTILKNFDATRVWGSIYNSQNYNKWKELKKGDILLFYHNKKYVASGILEGTEHNQELADYLWGSKDEESRKTFELMVFMQPTSVYTDDVDFQKLNQLLGYDEDFMPTRIMDFTTVNKDKTEDLIEQHGNLENALKLVGFSFNGTQNEMSSNLEDLIKKFDKNRNLFKSEFSEVKTKSFETRDLFLDKFPIEKIPDLTLDDYVIGKQNENSFCHMLEHSLPIFGRISGRFSTIHGVYWAKDENRYKWRGKFTNENEAFSEIKKQIHSMLLAAKTLQIDGDWERFSNFMETQEKTVFANVKSKILCVYFPNLFLDLHKQGLLNYILDKFKIENKISESRYILQKQVFDLKNNHKIMSDWDNVDFGHFCFNVISNGVVDEEYGELEDPVEHYLLFYKSPPGKKSHSERNKWNDVLGHEYPYGKRSGAVSAVTPGSKAVWMYTKNDEIYFWGHGEIASNKETDKDKFLATMKNFERLGTNDVPKKASSSLRDKITSKERGKWNLSNAITEIDDKIYNEIIADELVKEKTFVDAPLPIPTPKDIREGIKEISEHLTIPPEKIREILTGLTSGNNIILSGPIGTGKTELARLIPEIFWKSIGGYNSNMFTATADWNTQDVIGGIVPKMNGESVIYKIQDGCVTESVRKNWDGDLRTYSPGKEMSFRGVWTIIDEFNRADIDKAFGQMFTALRTKDLKAPTDSMDNYEKIRIPKDYRIIGTLNSADKHYLFQLSDALKSRFLVIEIGLPEQTKKDEEIYYALKSALESLSLESNTFVRLKDGKVIKKDQKFYDLLYQTYNFLSFVRMFKKLGTAILKTVYQNLLAGYQMKYNLKDVLDNSINSVIVPQLEGLPEMELSLINNLQKNNLDEFFKDLNKSRNKRTVSKDILDKTLNFLKIPEKDFKDFAMAEIKEKKDQKVWVHLKISESKQKSEDKMPTDLKQVGTSLELLIEQSVI